MNVGFERIYPTPTYPVTASATSLAGLKWDSKSKVVRDFKEYLKPELRKIQRGRCSFCRRLLYDDYAAHLEHFVDKDQYSRFTFEIRNLALACGTCNGRKNGHFLSIKAKREREAKRSGVVFLPRCPVLTTELPPGSLFPSSEQAFRWVNPHVDIFSSHIELSKGWIFRGKTTKGRRTIRGVGLNDIGKIEQRALSERLETRGGKLSMLVGALAEIDHHRAKDIVATIVKVIARRKKSNNSYQTS